MVENISKKSILIFFKFCAFLLYYTRAWRLIKYINRRSPNVLMYHDVSDNIDPHINQLNINISIPCFKNQINFIKKHYVVTTFDKLSQNLKNSIIITFDDGFYSFKKNVFPILQLSNLNSHVFIITSTISEDKVMWRNKISFIKSYLENNDDKILTDLMCEIEKATRNYIDISIENKINQVYDKIKKNIQNQIFLNKNDLIELSKTNLVSFGTHTHNHFFLNNEKSETEMILKSKEILKSEPINFTNVFCAPFGKVEMSQLLNLREYFDYFLITSKRKNIPLEIKNKVFNRIELTESKKHLIFYELELVPLLKDILFYFRKLFKFKQNNSYIKQKNILEPETFENKRLQITIVIPTFNRKSFLKQIITNLYDQDIKNVDVKIIVVNAGSTDGTLEMLNKEFSDVIVINGSNSWWYTKSMNEGFKLAKKHNPDFVLTLNDDIKINNNYLSKLLEAVCNCPPNSIIGSITYTNTLPHQLFSSGVIKIIKWRNKYVKYHKSFANIEPEKLSGLHKTKGVPGRGMLIPFCVLEELHYFDEKFAQYHSDFDFCMRASKCGYFSFISWDAIIFCYVDQTASGSSFLKTPFQKFFKGFFNKHSRIYIPDNARYILRHGIKILFPITFSIFIIATFKAYFFNKKLK